MNKQNKKRTEPLIKQVNYGDMPVEIERKRIKNMYLRLLPPDGRIHISAPVRMPEEAIFRFIASRIDWINKHRQKISDRKLMAEPMYLSGESIPLWGRLYPLEVYFSSAVNDILFDGIRMILRVKDTAEGSTVTGRSDIFKRWYRGMFSREIPPLLEKWEKIIGVRSNDWYIRDMKTRWGTCNIKSHRICVNLQLVKKDKECLEYVIVHELVHLLEKSHNSVFKAYMDHFLPDWRNRKARLNGRMD